MRDDLLEVSHHLTHLSGPLMAVCLSGAGALPRVLTVLCRELESHFLYAGRRGDRRGPFSIPEILQRGGAGGAEGERGRGQQRRQPGGRLQQDRGEGLQDAAEENNEEKENSEAS